MLLSFTLIILIIFYHFTPLLKTEDKTDFLEFKKAIQELKYAGDIPKMKTKDSLFVFNPNTLNDNGWLVFGLSEGKLKVLRNYQKSGGYFKQKEDLKRCYAIGDDFYNKIKNHVSIPKIKKPQNNKQPITNSQQLIELNQADSLQLISIKGIGPFYAKQIIKYRNDLGGFISFNQFSEIWGLDKLNLEKVKSQIQIDTTKIIKINLNNTSIELFWSSPCL